jgi:hypothetical protein
MSGEVNEGDEDEGIWLVDFIYINKIEKWKLLPLLEVVQGGGQGGEMMG